MPTQKGSSKQMRNINVTGIDLFKVIYINWIILIVTGCNQMITPKTALEAITVTTTQTVAVSPTEGETTQMPPSLPTPADPGLQRLIEKAKEDLAQRLSISLTQIRLVESTEVEWSDSGLGCPQPGMDYLQVITPGYLILLEVNAQTYEYHSNRDTYFVYCENQSPPSIPKP
jgi:hypothetical protein